MAWIVAYALTASCRAMPAIASGAQRRGEARVARCRRLHRGRSVGAKRASPLRHCDALITTRPALRRLAILDLGLPIFDWVQSPVPRRGAAATARAMGMTTR
jgi:hypothetical protein